MTEHFAYVITRVATKPDNLDLGSFEHNFWPGTVIVDDVKKTGLGKRDYVDGAITFEVERVYLCPVEVKGDAIVFPEGAQPLLNQLAAGNARQGVAYQAVHDYAQNLLGEIEKILSTGGSFEQIHIAADNMERLVARGRKLT